MTRYEGWRRLATLHNRIEDRIERALQAEHGLSVNEFCVICLLSQQSNPPMRMQQLAEAIVLSQSAATRLVNRLEHRGLLVRTLCADDRRGIYAVVTDDGLRLWEKATSTHDQACAEALAEAAKEDRYARLVEALDIQV